MPRVEFNDLVTQADIAARLGLTRQRVNQLTGRDDFPEPVGRIGNYTVWRWPQVERWNARARAARTG